MTGHDTPDAGGSPASPSTILLEDVSSPRTLAKGQGDFARLIPANRPAQYAFSEIVERMKLDPDWDPHARRFIHIYDQVPERTLDIKTSDAESGSEREGSVTRDSATVWTGWYSLNAEQEPGNIKLGWIVGTGRQDLGEKTVDLLLTLQKKKHNVHGRHARLYHHVESNALMLALGHGKTVLLNGDRLRGGKRAFSLPRNGISFGDLDYTFEFTELSQVQYRGQLAQMRKKQGNLGESPPDCLQITPSETQHEYRGYLIGAPVAMGTYGVVCSAMRISTGDRVAVKRIRRTQQTLTAVGLEVEIYKRIPPHPNVCNLVEDVYSQGDRFFMGPSQVDEVYLFQEPLARDTFVDLIGSRPPIDLRMNAFLQVLEGLRHLHSGGITHRDIKPSNLMVATYQPLRVVIIDYGHATREHGSIDHCKGTIPYLAPEVLALKHGKSTAAYGRACDTFSAGLTGYQLLLLKHCNWGLGVSEASHQNILQELEHETAKMAVGGLLVKMLAWQPEDRPSMSELISSPIWNPYRNQLDWLIQSFQVPAAGSSRTKRSADLSS